MRKNLLAAIIAGIGGSPSSPVITATLRSGTSTYQGVAVGNGWWAEATLKNVTAGGTYSLTPDSTAKVSFPVTSPGYDASGNLTTIDRTVFATVAIRQSYPNQALLQEVQSGSDVATNLALSEYVYSGDTVGTGTVLTGAYTGLLAGSATLTNNSTQTYPKVIADWALPPKREWSGDLTLEVVAKHKFGRNGRPVAAVKITGTNGTDTVTKTCTYGLSAYGDNLETYAATFNTSEFPAGGDVTFNFVAYPWVGDATAVLDSSTGTFPSVTALCGQVYRVGAIANKVYAYVTTTGNDGTGAVSTSMATAKTTAFATIAAAAAAIFAARTNASGCVLYIGAGSFNWPSANITGTTRTAPDAWMSIEGDPDDADPKNNCIINTVGATYVTWCNNGVGTMAWLRMANLNLNQPVACPGLLGVSSRMTNWMDNIKWTSAIANTTSFGSAIFNYFTKVDAQCSNQTARMMQVNGSNIRPQLIRNCTSNRGMQANVNVSSTMASSSSGVALGDVSNIRFDNLILANFTMMGFAGAASALNFTLNTSNQTFQNQAVSNCLFVGDASNIQPLAAFGENVVTDQDNLILEYITTAGGANQTCMRLNIHNDPTSFPTTTSSDQARYKDFCLTNNLLQWVAIKDDIFSGANEGNTGANLVVQGWPKAFGVGFRDNASAYTPDEWAPPYFGVGSLRAQARTFSGSTYVPTSGFATCAIQSLSYDLGGTARRQDGTGASGAYES